MPPSWRPPSRHVVALPAPDNEGVEGKPVSVRSTQEPTRSSQEVVASGANRRHDLLGDRAGRAATDPNQRRDPSAQILTQIFLEMTALREVRRTDLDADEAGEISGDV